MKLTTFILPLLLLGFILGQYSITSVYNIHTLEENALDFTQIAYEAGCVKVKQDSKFDCRALSKDYRAEIEKIFHNKIWENKK
jgi:hypothetical protein